MYLRSEMTLIKTELFCKLSMLHLTCIKTNFILNTLCISIINNRNTSCWQIMDMPLFPSLFQPLQISTGSLSGTVRLIHVVMSVFFYQGFNFFFM